jgi:hypothetical protein
MKVLSSLFDGCFHAKTHRYHILNCPVRASPYKWFSPGNISRHIWAWPSWGSLFEFFSKSHLPSNTWCQIPLERNPETGVIYACVELNGRRLDDLETRRSTDTNCQIEIHFSIQTTTKYLPKYFVSKFLPVPSRRLISNRNMGRCYRPDASRVNYQAVIARSFYFKCFNFDCL